MFNQVSKSNENQRIILRGTGGKISVPSPGGVAAGEGYIIGNGDNTASIQIKQPYLDSKNEIKYETQYVRNNIGEIQKFNIDDYDIDNTSNQVADALKISQRDVLTKYNALEYFKEKLSIKNSPEEAAHYANLLYINLSDQGRALFYNNGSFNTQYLINKSYYSDDQEVQAILKQF